MSSRIDAVSQRVQTAVTMKQVGIFAMMYNDCQFNVFLSNISLCYVCVGHRFDVRSGEIHGCSFAINELRKGIKKEYLYMVTVIMLQ